MNNPDVVTSVTHGTSIHMDACCTLKTMRAIALSLLSFCDNARLRNQSGILLTEANNGKIDFYVERYCHGVHGAILNRSYEGFADILYNFVLDCVKNQSVNGLYLWYEKTLDGYAGYEIITHALEVYDEFITHQYEVMNEKRPHNSKNYAEFNDRFKELFA